MSSVNVGRMSLVALFVTALVTAQLTAAKLLTVGLPVAFPVVGAALSVPGGVLAYALTFFASDCYAELYGRREATAMVNVGFVMNFVMLGLVAFAMAAPAASITPVSDAAFDRVMGPSANVVAGSLLAYLVSQNLDVFVFHRIREATEGRHLWLRNVGSTATSQFVDTAIFIGVGFAVAPALRGKGLPPAAPLAALLVGQYLLKVAIAAGDTPFVYAVVRYVRETELAGRRPVGPGGE